MENTEDYLDSLFQQSTDPKPTKNTATREEMIALLEANMEKYGITNPYMKNAMMGIILSEGGFKGVGENMYYHEPGRLAEVWSTFSTYKNSKGQTVRAPKGQGSKYANELAKSGKYIKNPEALGDFIYGNRMGNIEPGEGYKYRGRGLNQLTGKKNYKAIGDKLGVDLVNNPDLLIQDPNLQAEVAVRFLFDAIDKTLPALVKRNPKKYGQRFPNLDYNNYTNQEDATYLLTSANVGFGTPLKAETINKRLAQSKKFNYHLNDRPVEELVVKNEIAAEENEVSTNDEEINSIVPAKEAEAVAPFDQWDQDISNYDTENTEKVQVPFDQEDIKYSSDNYENTVAEYNNSAEGFDSSPVNNLDENQQKRNKLFNAEILKGLRMPQINRGQSIFGRGSLFGADKKKYGGSMYPRYYDNGGSFNIDGTNYTLTNTAEQGATDPMKFMVDAETDNLKTYNFDTGRFDVSNTAFEGDTSGMMSHISDIYEDDDSSLEAAGARAKKAEDLAKWSAERTKGAQQQIANRSIRNLGKTTWEQGSPFKNFLDSIGGARCITGSSCNLSPTPGDSSEPSVENLARVPYYIKDKKGNWVPNKSYTKAGRQKVGISPSVTEQNAAPKGGIPGGPIPVVTGNQSFASRYKNFGMELQKQGVLPQSGDIQVLHGFEEKEWVPNNSNDIHRGDTDTGYWRRKKNPDGSPVYTNGIFVYGLPGNSNHAQTIGPYLTKEISDDIALKQRQRNAWYGDYTADDTKLTKTDNPGGGRYDFVGKVDPNIPSNKGTATLRYKGSDPMFQKIAEDAAIREMEAFENTPIQRLNITTPKSLTNNYPRYNELPSVLLERARNFKNKPYATGGTLEKPCPPGKIFSVEFDECVTYKVWEQIAQSMSTDFDMDAVKKTNENFYDTTEWFKQYYNSPKYKEMVKSSVEASGSPGNVEEKTQNIITSRDAQLETVPPIQILKPNSPYNSFNNDPIPPLGYSNSRTGKITMIDHPDYPGGFRQGTVGHELSHSTDRPGYSWGDNTRLMPQSDVDYIESRKPKYIGDTRKYWNNKPFYDWLKKNDINAFRKTQKKTLDWTNYIGDPTETRARLNDIRKFAQSKGIYDPFTEEFEYKHYKELLKQKKTNIKGLKELQEAFGDDEIIWMFNHISKNKNNNTDDKEGIA